MSVGAAASRVTGWDMDRALAHLSVADPVMAALAERHRPSLDWGRGSRFYTLAVAIVSQQLSSKAAATIMRRLLDALAVDAELLLEAVLAAGHDRLRAAGLSNAKARYLRGLAEAVVAAQLDLGALDGLADEEVIATLTAVRGIGPWTAEMFLIFTLQRPDVLSTGDLGIRTAVKRCYALETLPGPEQLRRIAEPWHPYCSAALLLLWESLDNPPAPV